MPKPNIIDLRGQLPTNGTFPTRPLSNVQLFAIHYDGTDLPDPDNYDPISLYKSEAQYHIDKDWGGGAHGYGIEYIYKIDRKGQWYQLNDETALTWNAMNANSLDLPICLDAGPNTPPTDVQLASLKVGLDWLCNERPDIPANVHGVYGHGELVQYGNSTDCPGAVALTWVQAYRNGTPLTAGTPPNPTPSVLDQVVTILSVIGDTTYKQPVNLVQIQVLVQQAKKLLGA